MPDGHCKNCFECNAKFGIFRRRHHCRFCGRIFCFQCSNHVGCLSQTNHTDLLALNFAFLAKY
ncbi:unnamed protein product, partial [Dibothriocephalus latus]